MTRFLTSAGFAALALASSAAMAQDEDVAVSRDAVDAFVTGEELVESGAVAAGECQPTSDEEYMRTGVETICAERGGPIRTYFSRSAQRPSPAPTATPRPSPRPSARASAPAQRPAPRPRVIRIPERCAPTQSEALNMCLTFGLGSASLTDNARSQVRVFAESLIENESTETFLIAGHTDTSGESLRNCELSRDRAQSVVSYMVELGVPADRLRAVGFGQDRLQDGISPSDARNRRVEIVRGDAELASAGGCAVETGPDGQTDPA